MPPTLLQADPGVDEPVGGDVASLSRATRRRQSRDVFVSLGVCHPRVPARSKGLSCVDSKYHVLTKNAVPKNIT